MNNIDLHFKKTHIVNFDMIKNNPSQETIKQYQTIDHDEIKRYPVEYQDQIRSSIFVMLTEKICLLKENYN